MSVGVKIATAAETKTVEPVKARLISSVDKVTPGVPCTLGVLLTIEKGWHVYWKYAGDAGLPPKISWQLPPGWKASEIQWPLPKRFVETGPLTTYGYSDSVVLLFEVTPSASAAPGRQTLKAKAKWLVCHDECIPGGADIEISFPIEKSKAASDSKSIARWKQLLSQSLTESGITTSSTIKNIDTTNRSAILILTIKGGPNQAAPSDWFPAPTGDFTLKNLAVTEIPGGLRVECEVHSFRKPLSEIGALESLIIVDESGTRVGVDCVTSLKDPSS